jgi:hypothetical protein
VNTARKNLHQLTIHIVIGSSYQWRQRKKKAIKEDRKRYEIGFLDGMRLVGVVGAFHLVGVREIKNGERRKVVGRGVVRPSESLPEG